jgi:hypothetical protein
MMFRDARKGQFEWRNAIAPLFGDQVVLLAMKHRRAPLLVSSALRKGLLRKGFPNGLDELAIFAGFKSVNNPSDVAILSMAVDSQPLFRRGVRRSLPRLLT